MNETKNQEERARMGAKLMEVRNSFEWVDE